MYSCQTLTVDSDVKNNLIHALACLSPSAFFAFLDHVVFDLSGVCLNASFALFLYCESPVIPNLTQSVPSLPPSWATHPLRTPGCNPHPK